ncbi:GntR family transcriptional regulator [Georgenia sp. AZ-5]|uniref:GntR family transcriptional regulator n=1 Tax=Georgenia sp. AZ-5 TaxID=3367526 RepID=UPI00375460DE
MTTAHQRVAELLREEISSGRWGPGTQLPGELELMGTYGVSRNTIRRALDTLSNANLVRRQQGKGTFVAEQGVSHVLGDLKSFTDIIADLGMQPGIRAVRVCVDPSAPDAARKFLPGAHLWLIERVRTANSQPFGFMQSWVPDALATAVTTEALTERQSLYRLMDETFGLRPSEATEIIRAEAATASEAQALEVPEGSPLLSTYRWTMDHRGQPIEYVRSASPGSLYEYVVKLQQ